MRLPGQSSPHTHTNIAHNYSATAWPRCVRCKARWSPRSHVHLITNVRFKPGTLLPGNHPAMTNNESLLHIWTHLVTTVFLELPCRLCALKMRVHPLSLRHNAYRGVVSCTQMCCTQLSSPIL